MSARLTQLWRLRIASRCRRVAAFALAALLLIGACAWMLNQHAADTGVRFQPSAPGTGQDASSAADHGTPPADESAPSVAAAKRVAARFLTGYLAYTYQQAPADALQPVAVPQLVRKLADSPPRPAATDETPTQRRSRVLAITRSEDGDRADSIALLAIVDDGERIYSLHLTLRAIDGAWRVSQVQGR